jgi:hypothetical protein
LIPLARPATKMRRNETRDILRPILVTLNRMPGVRVVRNLNLGAVVPYHRRLDPNPPRFVAGLGLGSADLVGIVNVAGIGRAFCLEVKLPGGPGMGRRKGALRPDQKRWLMQVRRFGGFACVVRSVDEAVAAVARCRAGESE